MTKDAGPAERRFRCTACGKCCVGWLPLSVADALANAGRFPLAMLWTAVRPQSLDYEDAARFGATIALTPKKNAAVRIAPTLYIPPAMPCPALQADNLCALQQSKPRRCRAMPFFGDRAESRQDEGLTPRPGWACDTGPEAPVVYRDGVVIDRADYDAERAQLAEEQPALARYAAAMVRFNPTIVDRVAAAANGARGGYFVTSVYSFLKFTPAHDLTSFARAQHGVLTNYAERLAKSHDSYAAYYREAAAELEWFARNR